MKDMITRHPRLAHAQRELKGTKFKGSNHEAGMPNNATTLAALLPDREVTDQLVNIYMENFEITYRLLHVPSFWYEYNTFWFSPQEGNPVFIVLLLLMLAATNCLTGGAPTLFRGDSSLKRETSLMWIRHCDQWLRSQSQKHTILATFQLHCLLFIAKQVNGIKRKQNWTSAGLLIRTLMSAGLHRDLDLLNLQSQKSSKKVSVFCREMRRRIWATACELELQAALGRGMPTMLRDIIEDCGTPVNLEDEDFDQSSENLPESKPISQFTISSYHCLARSSLPLRIELACLINGSHPAIPYEQILVYDQRLLQHLNAIPQWSQTGLVSRILLQLQIHEILLFMHRPYLRGEAWEPEYGYSVMAHLKSAASILDLHQKMQGVENSFLALFRSDLFGATLGVCYSLCCTVPKLGTSV